MDKNSAAPLTHQREFAIGLLDGLPQTTQAVRDGKNAEDVVRILEAEHSRVHSDGSRPGELSRLTAEMYRLLNYRFHLTTHRFPNYSQPEA